MEAWERIFQQKVIATLNESENSDPAHDFSHFERVARLAKSIGLKENARLEIIIPAAWLHDLVFIPKNDPKRSLASQISGKAAVNYLKSIDYPEKYYSEIQHAIEAHSYSANIPATTLEAKVVQDADRLDGIGAIGIARCFTVGGTLNRKMYLDSDPFAQERAADDRLNTLDHFFCKLLKIEKTLQTAAGKAEGKKRTEFLHQFLDQLRIELSFDASRNTLVP